LYSTDDKLIEAICCFALFTDVITRVSDKFANSIGFAYVPYIRVYGRVQAVFTAVYSAVYMGRVPGRVRVVYKAIYGHVHGRALYDVLVHGA